MTITQGEYARLMANQLMEKAEDATNNNDRYHYYESAMMWINRISRDNLTVADFQNREICLEMSHKYV